MIRKLLFIPPILIGIAVLYFMASGRDAPERKPPQERARAVRVITAEPVRLVPRVTGFGSIYPGTVWSATAQVSGEVIYVDPQLKKGAILPKGTEIVRISPADFELAISQAEANIRSAEAKLAELTVTEANTADLLKIEQQGMELREAELKRKQELFAQGTVAQSALQLEQRETVAQRKKLQDLKNTLRLLPTQREVQKEQIAVSKAQLASAKLDLRRTRIKLPFDAKIAEVNVEANQFVQTGGKIVTADSLDVAEVEAQIPISQFRDMVHAGLPAGLPDGITAQTIAKVVDEIGFAATVRLRAGDDVIEWPARFARVSDTIDPKTRTIGAIVTVDDAYAKATPGDRPPLTKGMFVEIEIRTKARDDKLVVPRAALHEGKLYVVNTEKRLEIREVKTGLAQGDLIVIDEGLTSGDTVVVSDLIPAVEGMLLRPQTDDEVLAELKAEATGRATR
ncbi:MAG: efflux RND transporter periplasmic adaptor subunit [Rhizobiales bacterium]|nr:efflux RND transporter periplasmic adaptor subunit [Hyphomicrobiales bacterium]